MKDQPDHIDEALLRKLDDEETKMLQATKNILMSSKKIATAILDAAKLHAESFNDVTSTHGIDVEDAVKLAFEKEGISQLSRIIYLALNTWWNDTIEWAERVLSVDSISTERLGGK